MSKQSAPVRVHGVHDNADGKGTPSGCGWYRICMPFDELKRRGHHMTYAAGEPKIPDGCQVMVGQRFDNPDVLKFWRRMRAKVRTVYEIDDDIWHVPRANWMAYRTYNWDHARDAVETAAAMADIVTVTTEPLAEILRKFNPEVRIVPNVIPGALLGWKHDEPDMIKVAGRETRQVRIGWRGGASHALDVQSIATPVRNVLRKNPHARLHVIGTDFRPTFGVDADYTDWVPVKADLKFYRGLTGIDIGLAPLYGIEFDRSKCIDSSMRICTDRGLVEAGLLEPGMKVWRDGWRKIEATAHDAPRPGLLITTEGGYQLRLTSEHRMMTADGWKRADEIQPGDRMPMSPEWAGVREQARTPWPAGYRVNRSYSGRPPTDPDAFLVAPDGPSVAISPRWGRLLGAFAGDGSCSGMAAIQVSCDGQDQDWIDLLMNDLRMCGFSPRTEEIKTFDGKVLRRRGVRVSSTHLVRALVAMGMARGRPSGLPVRVPCVPEVIWRSPRDVVAEFLAGYFEADGHCTGNGVAAVSKDEQLIRDVQRLLLLFGITSVVRSRIHEAQNGHSGEYWHVTLRRAEADVFAKEIGFRSQRKQGRLAAITGTPHGNRYRPMSWSKTVMSVEPCVVTPVDIQVEGSIFIAAGFVSHNSAIAAMEYAAFGIPTIASYSEAYRDFIVDGKTGYLIRRKSDWAKRIAELVNDHEAREAMGAAAKERVAAMTVESEWPNWLNVYKELAR